MDGEMKQRGVRGFLSERMLRTAALVTAGNRTADVGCDHAYTSIYLVQEGLAPHVIAMDLNAGPLSKARENVSRFAETERIELRLSNGIAALLPGEADTVLIAGMGGPLMQEILEKYPKTLATVKQLVLQPQSDIPEFRRFLHRSGFYITAEDMLLEDGKYYWMMSAERGSEPEWTDVEYAYGKRILQEKRPVLADFLSWEYEINQRIYEELSHTDTPKAAERLAGLRITMERNRRAMNLISQTE